MARQVSSLVWSSVADLEVLIDRQANCQHDGQGERMRSAPKQAPRAHPPLQFYGYNSVKHGLDFAQDLKLGQYMVSRFNSQV
jgi:hypothetical protein